MKEEIVTVELVHKTPTGFMIGNTYECPVSEAVKLIKDDEAKAIGYVRMDVPSEWEGKPKRKSAAVVDVGDVGDVSDSDGSR